MSKSINIVFVKQSRTDKDGTIFIRTIENRIIKKKSLKIKVKVKEWNTFFNPKTKRFKQDKRFPLYELINQRIDEHLLELSKFGNDLNSVPNEKKSFLSFWKNTLNNFHNHGTIIKHKTIIKKLENYLQSKGKNDLLFKDITPIFLRELKKYLGSVKDPKVLSPNSVNHYLKVFKSIINQSMTDDYYTYSKHPFNIFKFTNDKIIKKVLNEKEIESLLTTSIKDERLNETRDMFLFQLFSNGMRVSDVLLLRWNNFSKERLTYNMFKTGRPINIPLNINMGIILSKKLEIHDKYNKLQETQTIPFKNEYSSFDEFENITLRELTILIGYSDYRIYDDKTTINKVGLKDENVKKLKRVIDINSGKVVNYKGYNVLSDDEKVKRVIDTRETLINKINKHFLDYLLDEINKLTNKSMFVFPTLSNELFKSIDYKNEFKRLSIEQYKNIKHQTIIYDRKLKLVQKLCKIETNLSSHVSRHTFTNLLLRMENVNLYDISQSLGHSGIKITENYLTSGFNVEKIDYLNKKVSNKYSVK